MALPTGLNDLAKLTLLASDTSYFDLAHPAPTALGSLDDTSYGQSTALYSVPAGFTKAIEFNDTTTTGFGFIAYIKNGATPAETEVIIALRGTDGPNPTDWVANSQSLGWNQWNQQGRAQVFSFLDSLKLDPTDQGTAFEGNVHFTGQSLGGGLAQYAAYEYVQSHQGLTGFSKANITLTTFNAFGGVLGLQQNIPGGYNPDILGGTGPNAIGSNAHFYTEGDLVSRLGSFGGVGHTGGTSYFLNAHASQIDPDTGESFLLNAIDAHRIETGFYPFLLPGVEFEDAVARPIEYLPMQNVQRLAALYGRILNDQTVSPLESVPRLIAGVIAGLSQGDPAETNVLVQAVLTNLHSANHMSDEWYVMLRKYDWGAIARSEALVLPAAAGYGLSLLGAILGDAVQFQVDRHLQLFNTLREWVSNAVPTVESSVSLEDRRVQAEMLLALVPGAAIGSKLAPVLQPLALDINAFAQTLVTAGTDWLQESLVAIRDQGNSLGQNLATLSTELTSAVADVAFGLGTSQAVVQDYLNTAFIPFVRDTANGYANAATDFLQDVAGAFDLGHALNFNDVNLIAQAYAAELDNRRLSSSVRAAVEEAEAIVQRAGQTVVLEKGHGPNPFNGTGFNPTDPGTISSATLPEGQLQAYTLSLPFEAGSGGQRVQLQLSGTGVSALRVRANGTELTLQNGLVTLTVPEGLRQLVFGLQITGDVDVDGGLSVSATLIDANSVATHTTHQEASLTVDAQVEGAINYKNGLPSQTLTGDDNANTLGPLGGSGAFFNVTAFGNGGDDWIFANQASQG
ncbi:MAG: hypothetical protein L0H94_10190, partial [Nitrospira sp.]|nr:hypothetical protein [Nitrospira sp.]